MVFLKDWDDFEIAAESMFMQNPGKCRFTLKYMHSKGQLLLKFTDNNKVSKWNFYLLEFIKIFGLSISVYPI